MNVVDETNEWLIVRGLRHETEHREPNHQPIRSLPGSQPKRDLKRLALRTGQPLERAHHSAAELMQPRVREFHLRLDRRRAHHPTLPHHAGQIFQQRSLADPRLAPNNEDAASAGPDIDQQLVQNGLLALTAPKGRQRGSASQAAGCSLGAYRSDAGSPSRGLSESCRNRRHERADSLESHD